MVIACLSAASKSHDRKKYASDKYQDADNQLRNDMIKGNIRIGMSEEQVIDAWGHPSEKAVRVMKTKVKVTLYFMSSNRVYLENDRVVGWNSPK